MSGEELDRDYGELASYTLAHPDPRFVHQHVVDAFAAQTAAVDSKPIKVAFALIGLYLYLEKGMTGKQVQRAHMQLAKGRKTWPAFALPEGRGAMTVRDVLAASPGEGRDETIRRWCESVWDAYASVHKQVEDFVGAELWPGGPVSRRRRRRAK